MNRFLKRMLTVCLLITLALPTIQAQTATPTPPKDTVALSTLPGNDSLVIKSTDTSKVTKISVQDVTAPGDTTVFGIKLPTWVMTVILFLMGILPTVQLLLKRIPTDWSIKIGGYLGKFLDVLTWFQKDVIKTPPATTTKTT